MPNADAAKHAEVVIISIPPEHAAATVSQIGTASLTRSSLRRSFR
jgi:predicted dinucleotide-binding enzyme